MENRQVFRKTCKYYTKHIETIRAYISCLYGLDDGNCCTGGLLHIVTDDGNLEDDHIKWCLNECNNHPEKEESEIGKLICNELLKLPMEQRRLVYESGWVVEAFCKGHDHCDECPIHNGDESFY